MADRVRAGGADPIGGEEDRCAREESGALSRGKRRSRGLGYGSAIAALVDEHCREYPEGTPPLSEAEVDELARDVPGWEREERGLTREFSFDDFSQAFGLIARVALLAEAESHHPRIELEWGRAAFTTWTHTADGLTRNDFILAAKIDQIAGA